MFERILLLLFFVTLSGCVHKDVAGYLDDHPEFSPIVSRAGKFEYQIVWYRSWQPIIYLKAHIEQNSWGESVQAFVSYASSLEGVPKLESYEVSLDEWRSIVKAVNESIVWSYDSKCDQLAYRKRHIYFSNEETGGCTQVMMLDGAKISIAISEPGREIGIYRVCNDLGPCEPFGDLARAILKTIGKENEAE